MRRFMMGSKEHGPSTSGAADSESERQVQARAAYDEYVKRSLSDYLRHLADNIEGGRVKAVVGHENKSMEGVDLFYLLRGGNYAAHEVRLSASIRYSNLPELFPFNWESKDGRSG
jgi:hypothetical protein